MKRFFSYCTFLLFGLSILSAQETSLTYHMTALGADIGTVKTVKKKDGDHTYITSESLFEVDLFFKTVTMTVNSNVHYHGGKLMDGSNKVMVNGEPRTDATIKWQGQHYVITVDGESKPPLKSPIVFSGSLLYHQEPINIQQAFSESSGIYMTVKPLANGKYQVVDPNNNRKMIHYYEGGVQTKVEIKHPLLTLHLTLEE